MNQSTKEGQIKELETQMLKEPGKIGLPSGTLNPKYVFFAQNPGEKLIPGTRVFTDPKCKGSSAILLPILEEFGILKDSFFDNVVKNTTPHNRVPSTKDIQRWTPYIIRELQILGFYENTEIKVIALGNFADTILSNLRINHIKISHPMRTCYNYSVDEYKQEIKMSLDL